MKKVDFKKLMFLGLITGLLGIYSCGDDPVEIPAPEVDFSYTIEGKTITVVNASSDGDSYLWAFGDGETSTEENTSHTYLANGSYVVTLTVTNETGEDVKNVAIEIINITIDGDFSDWDDVAAAVTYSDGEGGIALELKIDNLEDDKLFIYVKTSEKDSTGGFADFYFNTDNDVTGFASWYWPVNPGYDILIEGFLTTQAVQDPAVVPAVFQHQSAGGNTGWGWDALTLSNNFMVTSEHTEITGGYAFEFSIALSELPASIAPTDKVAFGIDFIYTYNASWGPLNGTMPQHGLETSAAYEYTLK